MALLSDRIALVTGSTSGIGRGIARRFAALGAKVVVHGRDQAGASQTLEAIGGEGGEAAWFAADLADAAACSRLVAFSVERFGGLDILVNNAALTTRGDIEHVPLHIVDSLFAVNLRAPLLLIQAAVPHLKARGGGAIVNIGSGSNKMPFPNLAAYTASKGGIELLTRVAAVELGPLGIRVNCVAPGAIEIERTRQELPDYAATWGRITPLRRIGTPDDVGSAVVFLASADASFVNGQTLWVDGALFSQAPWAYADEPAE